MEDLRVDEQTNDPSAEEFTDAEVAEFLKTIDNDVTHDLTTLQEKYNENAERIAKLEQLISEDKTNFTDVVEDAVGVYAEVRTYVENMCANVSLPGLRHISRGRVPRCVWLAVHVTATVFSVLFISDSYQISQGRPVQIDFKRNLTALADVPFPAVTVCSPVTFDDSYRVAEVVNRCLPCTGQECYRNSSCSDLELITLYKFVMICLCPDVLLLRERVQVLQRFRDVFTVVDNDQYGHIFGLTSTCDPEFMTVEGPDGPIHSCDDTFKLVFLKFIDRVRSCTTFNVVRNEDLYAEGVVPESFDNGKIITTGPKVKVEWTPDTMIGYNGGKGTIPMYNVSSVKITLKERHFCDKKCKRNYFNDVDNEHKISLHFPGEHTQSEWKFYSLPKNKIVNIRVHPIITLAQEELKRIDPSERGCFFAHERNLTMFKFYTSAHCDVQCYNDCLMNNCRCTLGNIPRESVSDEICLEHSWCANYIISHWGKNCYCDCLPACNYIDYGFTVSVANVAEEAEVEGLTTVIISFQDDEYPARVRYEVENLDFIATLLGTIATFNGFSLIAVCEIVYFLTVQLWGRIAESFDNGHQEVSGASQYEVPETLQDEDKV